MKKTKLFMGLFVTFSLVSVMFFNSVPHISAQTDQDWSDPINLSLSGSATDPVLVKDFRGTLHAIWADTIDDDYKYSQSEDGIKWTTAISVDFPFGPKDPPPFLLADANGSIHVFWISSDHSLFYGQSTPSDLANPGNWKTSTRLARNVLNYDVVVDALGSLHIAFIINKSNFSPAGVYYRKSIIGGGFWSEAKLLYVSEYFRSANKDNSYIRVSTSKSPNKERVYITWDNRAQKRGYMAVSEDTGETWKGVQQIKGPGDTGGIDTPFNLTVGAFEDSVLLIWQVGEPGTSNCTVYSQWSSDGGENWAETVAVLGGRSECPLSTKFVSRGAKYMAIILMGQTTPMMVAWNGEQWSAAQLQTKLPTFSNPVTFDSVLLGCRFDLIQDDYLYVTGCDQGRGGDVWFLSRPLEPVDSWFSPSSIWGDPEILSIKSEIPLHTSYISSTADNNGNIHVMWAQSPTQESTITDSTIAYARWNDEGWTDAETVHPYLNGIPVQLSPMADSTGRLLLSWVDESNGDLLYSWANLEKASLASEWEDVVGVPISSKLVQSPDIVVDGSGRVVIAYVIPVNEERGIYVVQSSDNGSNWSEPVKAFDAVASNWEEISQPKISIGSGGVLHLLFIRKTLRIGQPVGLYYSRSEDGGATWSEAQIMSEGEIHWADISSYGDGIVHAVWQEYDGLVFANVSQISQDGGLTWGKYNDITGVNNTPTVTALASDGHGLLHFVTLIKSEDTNTINQEDLILQDWKWNGSIWELELTKDIVLKGKQIRYSLSVDMTASGLLTVLIPVERVDPITGTENEILALSRFLEDSQRDQFSQIPIIPTPLSESNENNSIASEVAPTPDFSILYDDNVPTSPFQRNIAGILLIAVGAIVTILILVWRRSPKGQ